MGDKLPAVHSAGASKGLYGRFLKQARKRGKGKALPASLTLSPFRAFQARLGPSMGLKRGQEQERRGDVFKTVYMPDFFGRVYLARAVERLNAAPPDYNGATALIENAADLRDKRLVMICGALREIIRLRQAGRETERAAQGLKYCAAILEQIETKG